MYNAILEKIINIYRPYALDQEDRRECNLDWKLTAYARAIVLNNSKSTITRELINPSPEVYLGKRWRESVNFSSLISNTFCNLRAKFRSDRRRGSCGSQGEKFRTGSKVRHGPGIGALLIRIRFHRQFETPVCNFRRNRAVCADTWLRIKDHRSRSEIATQLFNVFESITCQKHDCREKVVAVVN